MRTPSDELFTIIKSLSSEEKRQFKLFSQKNSAQTNYLLLFDAIDRLEQYDEKRLLLMLNKRGGIGTLKYVKNYLQETLLKFLEYYYYDYSAEIQLQRQLQRIEILYNKRLFSSVKKCLVKSEKIAIDNHLYPFLFTILSWKRKLMVMELDVKAFDAYQNTYYLSELQYIDLYRNLVEYQKISIQVTGILINRVENLDKKTITTLNKILKNSFLKNEDKALSVPAKFIYFRTLGDIYLVLKNWKKSYHYLQGATGYFEQAKLAQSIRLGIYSRLIISLCELKRDNELLLVKDNAVHLIRSTPQKLLTKNMYAQYLSLMINYISYQLTVTDTDEALSISDQILESAEKHANTSLFASYYFQRNLIYFFIADYRKSLSCINKVLSKEKTGLQQDIISLAKILSLIIHYELGNVDMLPILCKSYFRYFERQSEQNKVENILLNFFGKTIQEKSVGTNKQTKIKLFTALKKELDLCKTEYILTQFDFIAWVESKIQNRPMPDILKEKLNNSVIR